MIRLFYVCLAGCNKKSPANAGLNLNPETRDLRLETCFYFMRIILLTAVKSPAVKR